MGDIDKDGMYGVLAQFPKQIERAVKLGKKIKFEGEIDKIVVAGMGGSGVGGELLKNYLDLKIPVFVNKGYGLPNFVNSRTLVFVVSYSGNTEETVNAYRAALRKGCKIVCITSGGKLIELAEQQGKAVIKIKSGIQPRAALAYLFFPMLNVIHSCSLIDDPSKDVAGLVKVLRKDVFKEKGKELAKRLADKVPIIYASDRFKAVAYRWKTQINENAKVHAFTNTFSELNHNEMVGYTSLKGYYYVVIIKDESDLPQIRKRMMLTKEIIRKSGVDIIEIGITGGSLLTKMFSAIYIGDWTSYYLALEYETDPTPVDVIEGFKKKL
jgi:glucose/mannose-6-phosphate isomerase